MKIYQSNEDKDIILREDEIDVVEELQERLGVTIRKMGKLGTYSDKQFEYIAAIKNWIPIKEWILEDFWTELDPEELYDDLMEDGDYDTISELGLEKDDYTGEVEVK